MPKRTAVEPFLSRGVLAHTFGITATYTVFLPDPVDDNQLDLLQEAIEVAVHSALVLIGVIR